MGSEFAIDRLCWGIGCIWDGESWQDGYDSWDETGGDDLEEGYDRVGSDADAWLLGYVVDKAGVLQNLGLEISLRRVRSVLQNSRFRNLY